MIDIKQTLERYLESVNQLEFKVYHENVMREIISSYDGEHSKIINDWLGYGGFYKGIGNDLYDYNGYIIKKSNEIVAFVSFEGPFEGEFEPVEIILDRDYFLNLKLEIPEIVDFDPFSLFVTFDFSNDKGFMEFSAQYFLEDKMIELHKLMNQDKMVIFQDYYRSKIHSNIQKLDLCQNVEQYWSAYCQENQLRYYISTEFFEITSLDYSIDKMS